MWVPRADAEKLFQRPVGGKREEEGDAKLLEVTSLSSKEKLSWLTAKQDLTLEKHPGRIGGLLWNPEFCMSLRKKEADGLRDKIIVSLLLKQMCSFMQQKSIDHPLISWGCNPNTETTHSYSIRAYIPVFGDTEWPNTISYVMGKMIEFLSASF